MTWPVGRQRHGGVDEVPLPDGAPGRLWLCGKHFVGPDHVAAMAEVGATAVVCLVEPHEIDDRYPGYVGWLREEADAAATWHPVPDLHAPSVDDALLVLADLRRRLDAGQSVLVHCAGGHGRAGTIAAGLLVLDGVPVDEAVATIAAARPLAGPQTDAQRDLLHALAARRAG